MDILIVGAGGREHALVRTLAKSQQVEKIYVAPGNYGISHEAQCVGIADSDIDGLLNFAVEKKIDLTVVGPERPLFLGIVDKFHQAGLAIFGPSQEAARIETSKWFAKELMREAEIPTGRAEYLDGKTGLDNLNKGKNILQEMAPPYVVKADGLYAGKGVVVTSDFSEAEQALQGFLSEGTNVVLEQYLEGYELSVLAITDGQHVYPLIPSQDYKRAYDNDQGPNTGGMGAYAPVPFITSEGFSEIEDRVLKPAVTTMKERGTPYRGVLYAGLMMTEAGPKVLEFNARFGDPETQAILPLLKSDLVDYLWGAAHGDIESRISENGFQWKDSKSVCVVLASSGYPGDYPKGKEIQISDQLSISEGLELYFAGVADQGSQPVTNGGRVLNVVSIDQDWVQAREKAYYGVDLVDFSGKQFRTDIALSTLK